MSKQCIFFMFTFICMCAVFAQPTFAQTVSLSPSSMESPSVGEQVEFSLEITGGRAVAGYEATVQFDSTALRYVSSENGTYLAVGSFFVPPQVTGNRVKLAATALTGESNGNGTLAQMTFEVVSVKASRLRVSGALLSNSQGQTSQPSVKGAQLTKPSAPPVTQPPVTQPPAGQASGTVSLSPASVVSPGVGEHIQFSVEIAGGKAVAGYEATVVFNSTALRYISSENGTYLGTGAFFVPPQVTGNRVKLTATALGRDSTGNGTLAKVTFEVVSVRASGLILQNALLSNSQGQTSQPSVKGAQITPPDEPVEEDILMDDGDAMDAEDAGSIPGPKIEGPWLWTIVPLTEGNDWRPIDYLARVSGGAVTEVHIATHGTAEGATVGEHVWTLGSISPTGENNINDLVNELGLGTGDINHHVAYGSIGLWSPRRQETMMYVGSDDGIKVWLNGKLVHSNLVFRGAFDYQESFSVTLEKGENYLLVAVYEAYVDWSGFFGFTYGTDYEVLEPPVMDMPADEDFPVDEPVQSQTRTPFPRETPQWHLPEGVRARLGKGIILDIAYSPDGTRLAVASGIGIWLYDTGSYREVDLLTGHTNWVTSVAFSPDGRTLASTSEGSDSTVRLWDIATGRHKQTLTGHTGRVGSVAFSPDGRTIAGESWEGVQLWDVATSNLLRTFTADDEGFGDVVFSPDGRTIASGLVNEGKIYLWETGTGRHKRTLIKHNGGAGSVAFSPDGKTLASGGSNDNTINLWDAGTGRPKRTLTAEHFNGVYNVAFSSDGRTLASTGGRARNIHLWDVGTGRRKRTLTVRDGGFWHIVFSPDGKTLANGSESTVDFWDVGTGRHKQTITGHNPIGDSVSFSPDGKTLTSAGDEIYLWDAATGKHKQTLTANSGGVYGAAFSPDGRILAHVGSEGDDHVHVAVIRLRSVDTGRLLHTIDGEGSSLTFSPDGQTLAGGSWDNTIRLWDANTGRRKRTLTGHTQEVTSIAFSPDGKTLASGSQDNTIRLWDATTGKPKRTLTGHTDRVASLAFSPDGRTLASGSWNYTIRLWDVATGRHEHTIREDTGWVGSVAFSPDGKTLASGGGWDNTIRLWDVATGNPKQTLTGHTESVGSVAFSPDGKTLASGSEDGTVLLWDITAATEVLISASQRPPMYWVNTQRGTLHRLIGDEVENLVPSVQSATSLAVDMTRDTLYWTEKTSDRSGKIRRSNLDGSEVKLVKNLTSVPLDIAVDATGTQLYLINAWGKGQRLNRDGSGFAPNLITGLTAPKHLILDNVRGKVYWTEETNRSGSIRRANLDGSGVQLVKNLTSVPRGLAIDTAIDKLLVATAAGQIQRMNLDGSDAEPDFITGLDAPGHPTVDLRDGRVYWTEGSSLRRATFEGADIETLATGLGAPAGIVLGIPPESVLGAPRSVVEVPDETVLLANYPNPFNPETWIPYHLSTPADVQITIYDTKGSVVRRLDLGHQVAGYYTGKSRAAYWDGRNTLGERVASGLYFYQFQAGAVSMLRKLVILK